MTGLTFRRAQERDDRFVWDVNNDPSVRQQSIQTAPIPWDTHRPWFQEALSREDRDLWIVELEGEACGVVRFDLVDEAATISIALAAEYRGRGLGAETIRRACEAMCSSTPTAKIQALVRPENTPSVRAFERAGFELRGPVEVTGVTLNQYFWEP